MARTSNNGGNRSVFFSFNPVLGWLYESSAENDAKLAEIRAKFDPDEWKKGFTGNSGLTADARKAARELGLKDERLSGDIVAAYYSEGKDEQRKIVFPRIRVKIVDAEADESYLVTLPLTRRNGQMLVQKLIAVEPGEHVTLTAFSTLSDNGYANDTVSLKDGNGKEIKGPEGLFKQANDVANDKVAKLDSEDKEDREIVGRTRSKAFFSFHKKLLDEQVAPKFEAYGKTDTAADDKAASSGAPAGGFDSMDDEIPF
ncbi:hypothetical protein [Burkholderia cepacia]|uniref:hypothetical protein n=1 Tax=Burkholderia cepacia TaxID=292 RepID=UPI002AB69099|nr:hypothetical protein [Burkholderia cepacia]